MEPRSIGDAEIVTYLKVQRKTGSVEYYKVEGGRTVEIPETEYKENCNEQIQER